MSKRIDLTGQRFGRWVVEAMCWDRPTRAICVCDCGCSRKVAADRLRSGTSTSCGCWKIESFSQRARSRSPDLTGQRFERLVVKCMTRHAKTNRMQAICLCDCGQETQVRVDHLVSRRTRSCGCLMQEQMRKFGKHRYTPPEKKARTRLLLHHAREARKRSLPSTFDQAAAIFLDDYWEGSCAVCSRTADFWHVIAWDHWIPLRHETCPGTTPGNILPLCHGRKGSVSVPGSRACNTSKGNKDPVAWVLKRLGPRKGKAKLHEIETYFIAAIAFAQQRTSAGLQGVA